MIQRKSHASTIEHQADGVTAGDTLVVAPDDAAIFARQGQFVRVLQPGSYQVPGEFAAPDMEVYFVRTSRVVDEKFGGPLPGGLPVRAAFGKFSWIVRDPERFVMNVIGSDPSGIERYVAGTFQKAVSEEVAHAAIKGAPLDASLHGPILAAANQKLGSIGVEALEVSEFMAR